MNQCECPRRSYLYVLLDQRPVLESDTDEWARWIANCENCIVREEVVGDVFISTVFSGIDLLFGRGTEPPLLFETITVIKRANVGLDHIHDMDFTPEQKTFRRCATWKQAEHQHRVVCEVVREASL